MIDTLTIQASMRLSARELDELRASATSALLATGIEVGEVEVKRGVFPPDMETMTATLSDGSSWDVCVPVAADWQLWGDGADDDAPTPEQIAIAKAVWGAMQR